MTNNRDHDEFEAACYRVDDDLDAREAVEADAIDCEYCNDTGRYVHEYSGIVGEPCAYCERGETEDDGEAADAAWRANNPS